MAVSKVYNGATFSTGVIKIWNGAAWVNTPAYYNGVDWVPLYAYSEDVITLSGTSGAPNNTTSIKADPTSAVAGWHVNADGTIDRDYTAGTIQFQAGTQWCQQTPVFTYWVKATLFSGTSPTSGTVGTWMSLATLDRSWTWTRSTVGTTTGILKLEIASDAAGASIVATGYYEGTATQEA